MLLTVYFLIRLFKGLFVPTHCPVSSKFMASNDKYMPIIWNILQYLIHMKHKWVELIYGSKWCLFQVYFI